MSIRSVEISNISLGASKQDLKEFLSFSGDIAYMEIQSDNERSQIAYVTFKDTQGAENAILLSGALIGDLSVTIMPAPNYQPPPDAVLPNAPEESKTLSNATSALHRAEDLVSSTLAEGYILGKDAIDRLKLFDAKHRLSSTASAKVASLDKKVGITQRISVGTSIVSDKVWEVDRKLQVSDKAKSTLAVTEQKVGLAGSALMNNQYVRSGASLVSGAFGKVTKVAGNVGEKVKEKVGAIEEEKKRKVVDEFSQIHLCESPKAFAPEEERPFDHHPPVQGLIL